MAYILSIDHGGSRTRAIVCADSGQTVYACDDLLMYYPQKPRACFTWQEHIQRLLEKINEKVGAHKYAVAVLSTNGANTPSETRKAKNDLLNMVNASSVHVVGDCVAALRGCELPCFPNGISVVLCAGSGFNCAMSIDGHDIQTLGWRINACDQGGYAIGRRIWQAVVDDFNGLAQKTELSELLLAHYHRKSLGRLIDDISNGKLRFSPEELSPLLFAAVSFGDLIASNIVSELAERWLGYVHLMLKERSIALGSPVKVYTSGGLFMDSSGTFEKALQGISFKSSFHLECLKAKFPPVAGAALLAFGKLHGKSLSEVQTEFQNSFSRMRIRTQIRELKNLSVWIQ